MKSKSIGNFASVAALAAILPLGIFSAQAVSAPTVPVSGDAVVQQSQFQRVEWKEEKKRKLRRAYWLVEHAKHDYKGHRINALEQIKKAGEVLGIDLHGDGYAGERQGSSDERLHEARALLKEVDDESGSKEHVHLHVAIYELDHALEAH